MKHGKKPTVAQMEYIKNQLGLDPKSYLIVKWSNNTIVLENRATGKPETFPGLNN